MTRRAVLGALGAVAVMMVPVLFVAHGALADHGCPYQERKRYDFTLESRLGGDLFAVQHVVGFADFKECHELRNRILKDEVRFEARGGTYELRLMGDGFDDLYTLRGASNATPWYDLRTIERIQFAGIAADGSVVLEPGLGAVPPATTGLDRSAADTAGAIVATAPGGAGARAPRARPG